MSIKTQYVVYTAKNFSTGLTDVTANVFLDGATVAIASGLALAEISVGDMQGAYRLTLSPTQINAFGGVGVYQIRIDSASKAAPATAKLTIQANDNDDLEAHLVVVEGKIDVLSSNLALLQGDVTSVKATVENTNTAVNDGTDGLSAIKAAVDTAISGISAVQNATRTVVALPAELITPATGATVLEVLIRIYNGEGALEDPDSNIVNIFLRNSGGLDRGNLFTGGGGSPKQAIRTDQGKYKIELTIPAGTTKEQINMLVGYTEGAIPLEAVRSATIVDEIQASGLAQQVTSQAILDDTAVMQPQVALILSEAQSALHGFAIIKSAVDAIDLVANDTNTVVNSVTIGNQAIIDAIAGTASQTSLNNLIGTVNNIAGAGFDTGADSLKQISDRQFTGGTAV